MGLESVSRGAGWPGVRDVALHNLMEEEQLPLQGGASQIPLRFYPEALAPKDLQVPHHLLVLGLQVCVWWPSQAWMCQRVRR